MVDVQFDEGGDIGRERLSSHTSVNQPQSSMMIRWLAKVGINDERVAGRVLIFIAGVIFLLSIIIFMRSFGFGKNQPRPSHQSFIVA